MDKPIKFLLTGTSLALLIFIGGYLTSIYDSSQITSLVEKCKTETAEAPKGPWLEYQKAPLVCDPGELTRGGLDGVEGIQKEIVAAQLNAGRTFNNAIIVAIIVFVLLSAPYAWYFLLRRIRELRDAIAGK
ncbi:MAG: hypothetical protein ACRESK_08330 [Gammaproteobacteria bacterium]